MKTFSKNLTDNIHKGLRTTPELGRRRGDLKKCFNFIVDSGGLRSFERITNVIGEYPLSLWPFPQVFRGALHGFIVTEDVIYDYNSHTTLVTTSLGGSVWDMVDFFDFVVLCNSNYCLIRNPSSGSLASAIFSDEFPKFATACNFRGQMFVGNLTPIAGTIWESAGSATIAWSLIGESTFRPGNRNEANFTRLPWDGEVFRIMQLADGVIAYAENGIMGLIPLPSSPSVGQRIVLHQGILSRQAVAGDDGVHLFVDKNYYLWKISQDLVPKRIGYQEYLKELGPDLSISYDKVLKRFYISNGTKSYCITAFAMTEVFQSPTYVDNCEGFFYSTDDERAIIETSEMDFERPGLKSIETVSVTTSNKHIQVGSKSYDTGTSVIVQSDETGNGFPRNTGNRLSVIAVFNEFEKADIQSLIVEGKFIDRRFTRGYNYDKETRRSTS